ncbi:MAG: hypothetical protein Q8P81_02390 [Nanoarchaeota archaeon]|nr:hypothetical protein [Nanoarchaeota archaeon]
MPYHITDLVQRRDSVKIGREFNVERLDGLSQLTGFTGVVFIAGRNQQKSIDLVNKIRKNIGEEGYTGFILEAPEGYYIPIMEK